MGNHASSNIHFSHEVWLHNQVWAREIILNQIYKNLIMMLKYSQSNQSICQSQSYILMSFASLLSKQSVRLSSRLTLCTFISVQFFASLEWKALLRYENIKTNNIIFQQTENMKMISYNILHNVWTYSTAGCVVVSHQPPLGWAR